MQKLAKYIEYRGNLNSRETWIIVSICANIRKNTERYVLYLRLKTKRIYCSLYGNPCFPYIYANFLSLYSIKYLYKLIQVTIHLVLFARIDWRIPGSVAKECQGPVSRILLLPIFSSRSGRGDPSDRGRYQRVFHVVPSHDSLEIRGSHHKSADLNAPPMAQSGRSNELRE